MILPDMTCQQMVDVLRSDIDAIRREDYRYMSAGGFRLVRDKKATFPMQVVHAWVSPKTHQRYLINAMFAKRKEAFDRNYRLGTYAIIHTQYGYEMAHTILYNMERDNYGILYYHAHLFNRYAERMHINLQGEDVIRYFIKRNGLLIQEDEFRKELPGEVMMTCYDGACFGQVDPNDERRVFLKTFIANETMQEGYKAQFNAEYDKALCDGIKDAWNNGDCDIAYDIACHVKRRKDGKPSGISK